MADSSISVYQDQFVCPVCLDLLKDPVTIPCGHSYCMNCISGYWNQDDQMGICSCPQCRRIFTPRPALGKNVVISEMMEKLKKTPLRTAVPGDVQCDICTGKKHKAVKSCLVCLNSYCQTHFEHHEEFHPGKRHKVIEATGRLQEMICPKHDKLQEVFCRTDKKCICILCTLDEHRNHDTVSAAEDMTTLQGNSGEMQRRFQQNIQQRERELQELREAVESHKRSAQVAVEDSERIFTELIRSIERSRSELTQMIRDHERASVSRLEQLLERLKQEIADLRTGEAELEKLSHTDNHITFLQGFQSLSLSGSSKLPRIIISSLISFDDFGKSVSRFRDKMNQYCLQQIQNITVKHIQIILGPEYETREEYLRYFRRFTLDPNTTHNDLLLSDGNTAITSTRTVQPDPDHPDTFHQWVQVLCRERVSGRCYWEVDWGRSEGVGVSVSCRSISQKGHGDECRFGCTDQSWKLFCSPSRCLFRNKSIEMELPGVTSSRIGVYVDHSAGILSFYSVSDTMSLIHRVHTTFTQPLNPGILLGKHTNTVKLCHIRDSVKY
ncbi:Tripartite motif-containing protein 16 [Anabarilius grahami]|uniref:Tripartite motif-containing protein 16 n=1 Tax=Anabarilius grahami TaxID=495550 RepID=A0A3N0XJP2_ANAGA|nr:Tripartite motif-containing protein 16 [Anabarilius grahami]